MTTRRRFLGATAAALAAGVAGCTSADSTGCDESDRSSVAAERAIPPEDVRDAVVPIRFDELPDAEKDVAATAIRGDSYAECSPLSEAFASFLDRVRDSGNEQQERSQADLTTVYLVRERTYYSLSAERGDVVLSD